MISPRRAFYLTTLTHTFGFTGAGGQVCSLTCDLDTIRFVGNLPYIGQIYPGNARDTYVLAFDIRYDAYEAWHELNRELQAQTQPLNLDPIWEIEGDDDDALDD